MQKSQQAIVMLTHALTFHPKQAVLYFVRGKAHLAGGDSAAAISDFSDAIGLHPKCEQAYFYGGKAKAPTDAKGAISDFDQAIRLGLNPLAYYERARLHLMNGKQTLTKEDCHRAPKAGLNRSSSDLKNGNFVSY